MELFFISKFKFILQTTLSARETLTENYLHLQLNKTFKTYK